MISMIAPVLRPKDIAARLGVDPRSVRRAIARGDLQASRACGLRVLVADAASWWLSHAVVPVPVEQPAAGGQPPRRPIVPAALPRHRSAKPAGRLPLPARGGRS
jgi:hypothetical protein